MSRAPTLALIAFGGLAAAGLATAQLDLSWLRALVDPAGGPEKVVVPPSALSTLASLGNAGFDIVPTTAKGAASSSRSVITEVTSFHFPSFACCQSSRVSCIHSES